MPSKIFEITWPDLYGPEWIQPEHVRHAICKTFRKNVFDELVIDEIPSEITDAKEGEEMKTKRATQETIYED